VTAIQTLSGVFQNIPEGVPNFRLTANEYELAKTYVSGKRTAFKYCSQVYGCQTCLGALDAHEAQLTGTEGSFEAFWYQMTEWNQAPPQTENKIVVWYMVLIFACVTFALFWSSRFQKEDNVRIYHVVQSFAVGFLSWMVAHSTFLPSALEWQSYILLPIIMCVVYLLRFGNNKIQHYKWIVLLFMLALLCVGLSDKTSVGNLVGSVSVVWNVFAFLLSPSYREKAICFLFLLLGGIQPFLTQSPWITVANKKQCVINVYECLLHGAIYFFFIFYILYNLYKFNKDDAHVAEPVGDDTKSYTQSYILSGINLFFTVVITNSDCLWGFSLSTKLLPGYDETTQVVCVVLSCVLCACACAIVVAGFFNSTRQNDAGATKAKIAGLKKLLL
jgi:hypothetical protein